MFDNKLAIDRACYLVVKKKKKINVYIFFFLLGLKCNFCNMYMYFGNKLFEFIGIHCLVLFKNIIIVIVNYT